MATTQSEDPNERVNHPRHYNQHPANIETIELIEHLPCNTSNAVKYIWRCGLKTTDTPRRDLESALWYTRRERDRIRLFELSAEDRASKTDVVWRSLAKRIIEYDDNVNAGTMYRGALAAYLHGMLLGDFNAMLSAISESLAELEMKSKETE